MLAGKDLSKVGPLPKNTNLFQNIRYRSLYKATIPAIDLSIYNFKGVSIIETIFHHKCIFPKNENFFQIISKKSIKGARMPVGNYKNYIFDNVDISGTFFPENSELPMDRDFFQKIKDKNIIGTNIPTKNLKMLHLYNMKEVKIDLSKLHLNRNQKILILMQK